MTRNRYSNAIIKEVALAAMEPAGREFAEWTKQEFRPLNAPEYIFTVGVARALAELDFRPGVYCEYNAKAAIRKSNRLSRGRKLSKIKNGSRVDIIVTRQDLTPMFAIELKGRVNSYTEKFSEAVHRIADVVGPKGDTTMPSGMVLFGVDGIKAESHEEAEDNLRERIDELRWGAQDDFRRMGRNYRVPVPKIASIIPVEDYDDIWCWTFCALIIEPGAKS